MNCKSVGRNKPRVLIGHHEDDCTNDLCGGCQPCTELHCGTCEYTHATVTCAECVAVARDNLGAIATLCGALPAEAAVKGVEGEAMMLLGPAANAEAWGFQAMSAMMGRIDPAYLADNRDEAHPLYVLGYWAEKWRIHLGHHTDLDLTLERAVDYLSDQMSYMATQEDPPFDEFAKAVAECRSHLEDVVMDGERDEKGAPCVQCGRNMTRVVQGRHKDEGVRRVGSEGEGAQDAYHCRPCRRTVSGDQYRYAVGAAYKAHATRLTAADLHAQYGVSTGSVRGWASSRDGKPPLVRKRGKDANGRQLYDVADVVSLMPRHAENESA